jgi:capsular polysaccharide biosynthesis protein
VPWSLANFITVEAQRGRRGSTPGMHRGATTVPRHGSSTRRGDFTLRSSQLNGRGHNTAVDPGLDHGDMLGGMLDDPQASYQVDPIQVLRRRFWVIILVACIVVGLATGFTYMQTPTYIASTTILIGQDLGNGSLDNLYNEVQGVQSTAETVTAAITTGPVAEGVVDRLDLQMSSGSLLANLQAEQIGTSQFIVISYEDTDPERAQLIANAVGDVFSEQIADVSSSANSLTAKVWEEAAVPGAPVSPDPMRNMLLALVLGLMLGVGLAFLLDHLDDDWKSPEEVELVAGVPTFGVIPTFKVRKKKRG